MSDKTNKETDKQQQPEATTKPLRQNTHQPILKKQTSRPFGFESSGNIEKFKMYDIFHAENFAPPRRPVLLTKSDDCAHNIFVSPRGQKQYFSRDEEKKILRYLGRMT